jgi:hypothetical protein
MTPARRRVRGWKPITASVVVCVLTVAGATAASATPAQAVPAGPAAPAAVTAANTAANTSATVVTPTSGGLPMPILIWAALGIVAAFVGLAMANSGGRARKLGRRVGQNTALAGITNVGSASAVPVLRGGEH